MNSAICFIIVTFNSQKQIKHCLDSIFIQEKNIQIIIVDNDSQDDTPALIEKIIFGKKNICLLKNKKNLGFAQAINQGINYARKNFNSKYFFLLNPDAYLEKNCLKKIFSYFKLFNSNQNKPAINAEEYLTSPVIINPLNNHPWFAGAKISWFKFKTKHYKLKTKNHKLKTDYLTGCALLVPQKIINKVGLLDEKFFLYYEDVDFSWRVKKAGFRLKIIPQAIVYHQESQSSNSEIKNYHLVKSGLIFFHKHYPKLLRPYFWLVFYLRFFYHKFFSCKKEVFQAMWNFKKNN